MTACEQIMASVAKLVLCDGKRIFTRVEVRDAAGVDPHLWMQSYNPQFQGMREDQPGGGPQVLARFRGVFHRIAHGEYQLTERGVAVARQILSAGLTPAPPGGNRAGSTFAQAEGSVVRTTAPVQAQAHAASAAGRLNESSTQSAALDARLSRVPPPPPTASGQAGVPPTAAGVSTGRPSVPRPGPDPLDWPRLLKRLGEQLDGRLSRHIPTTEDTVRYLFFLELLDAGVTRDEMVLERPHPHVGLKGKEIDLSLLGMRSVDLEVKYHRPIPSGRNSPLTQLRGQLIADWYNLALSNARERFSLYAAAPQIAEHMQKHLFEALEATADRPFAPEDDWLERSEKTVQGTIKGALGFLPRGVPLRVHCVAAGHGQLVSVWLLMIT